MKTIYTKKLYLRRFCTDDITQTYLNALNDDSIIGLTEARHKKWNVENVLEYINNSNVKGVSLLVGIFLISSDKPIGNIRLFNFHDIHKRAELGILIYDKSEWGKGYGTEALKAISDYGFKELGLHRITADYYKNNIGSAKIFEKAGYKIEGVFCDHFYLNNKYVDSIRIALINE